MNLQRLTPALVAFASFLLLGILILSSPDATSAPPGGGGGGGSTSTTGGGTIYYSSTADPEWLPRAYGMNSDGSGKTLLATRDPYVYFTSASRLLHGGRRWVAQTTFIEGEFYPNNQQRREIFALRLDGAASYAVQLTNDATLEYDGDKVCWLPGGGAISFVARRWSGNQVVHGGIYIAQLAFDAAGNITGLQQQPTTPSIAIPLVMRTQGDYFNGDLGPDLWTHDWAPDSSRVVYDRYSQWQLRIATLSGQNTILLSVSNAGWPSYPAWSPDNTKIAFNSVTSNIDVIAPNGSGLKTLVKRAGGANPYIVGYPNWSPTGSHMVYWQWGTVSHRQDYYRVTSSGASRTNLTADLPQGSLGETWLLGWR
jgi:hypothetical protein